MSEVIIITRSKVKSGSRGKGRRSAKHKAKGTYRTQFMRTVQKTGRWRGKKVSLADAR